VPKKLRLKTRWKFKVLSWRKTGWIAASGVGAGVRGKAGIDCSGVVY
jgi:hypothetical protein